MKSRRCKILYINEDLLLHAVLGLGEGTEIPRYKMKGLPQGWEAEDIHYKWEQRVFGVRLYRPDFDEVEEGMPYPEIAADSIQFEQVEEANKVGFREFL